MKTVLIVLCTVIFFTACMKKEKTGQINEIKKKESSKIVAYVYGGQDNWGENNEKANILRRYRRRG